MVLIEGRRLNEGDLRSSEIEVLLLREVLIASIFSSSVDELLLSLNESFLVLGEVGNRGGFA